jgi:cytoskeletal protein RodZ
VVIDDGTGRVKIFLFGGVAEQVVRRTAADLVEESSSNQILLPASLRSLVGRSYVFQVVVSEQTFRTGQLTFLARRVFASPADADGQRGGPRASIGGCPLGPSPSKTSTQPKEPSVGTTIETTNTTSTQPKEPSVGTTIETTNTTSAKENDGTDSTLAKVPTYVESASTPPPEAVVVVDGKNLANEKGVLSSAREDTGYAHFLSIQLPIALACYLVFQLKMLPISMA